MAAWAFCNEDAKRDGDAVVVNLNALHSLAKKAGLDSMNVMTPQKDLKDLLQSVRCRVDVVVTPPNQKRTAVLMDPGSGLNSGGDSGGSELPSGSDRISSGGSEIRRSSRLRSMPIIRPELAALQDDGKISNISPRLLPASEDVGSQDNEDKCLSYKEKLRQMLENARDLLVIESIRGNPIEAALRKELELGALEGVIYDAAVRQDQVVGRFYCSQGERVGRKCCVRQASRAKEGTD